MRAESMNHTETAGEYKNEQRGKLASDLTKMVAEYGKSLSSDQKANILKNILEPDDGLLDLKIAKFEGEYLKMRSKRGEKITIQDMDDIMPYVRLAMLRKLHSFIAERGGEGATALQDEIKILEGEITAAKTKIGALRTELNTAQGITEKAFKALLSSVEYKNLQTTQNALGKNKGALEAWTAAGKLVSDKLSGTGKINPGDITRAFDKLIQEYKTESENCNKVISKIVAIEIQSDIAGVITEENAGDYITEIDTLLGNISNDPNFSEYEVYLNGFKTTLDALQNGDPSALKTYIADNKASYDINLTSIKENTATKIAQTNDIKTTLSNTPLKIEEVKKTIASRIATLGAQTNGLTQKATDAKSAFEKKLNAIKSPIKKQTGKARELGKYEGTEATLSKKRDEKSKKSGEYSADTQTSEQKIDTIDTEKENTDASQKIRINARNLIVRSGPEKKAKPILDPTDKNKAIMLQPGDSVTPIRDAGGNVETKEDGPREYTHVILSDGTLGWIALSDKIGSKWKQEYGDISMGTESRGLEYQLKGDNIRLRSGAKTTADILDVLDAKKVKSIQAIKYSDNNAGDIVEGDGKLWRLVEVTYNKSDKKEKGYIAVDFLQEKTSSAKDAEDALKNL